MLVQALVFGVRSCVSCRLNAACWTTQRFLLLAVHALAEHAGQLSSLCLQGDVYHILFNLGEWLDGRVWPRKDQLEVLRLMDLIHHVTGLPLLLLLLLPLCPLALLPSGHCNARVGWEP